MPLTAKGEKILAAMQEQYGEEEGKRIFYASANAGTIEGVDAKRKRDDEDDDDYDEDDDEMTDARITHLSDRMELIDGSVRKTKDGYMAALARISRTGIQTYSGDELGVPHMKTVRVYRPPEEVFSKRSMRSLAGIPITLNHPPTMVDTANWKEFSVGETGDEVARDGEFVRVPLMIRDAKAIEAYERYGVAELSVGYGTELKWGKGKTTDGEIYDAKQTAIRGNHLAVVPAARGGSRLRIGDDERGGTTMVKTLINGQTIEFADELIAKHVTDYITSLVTKVADQEAKSKANAVETEQERQKRERAETDAKTKDGEIAVLKKQLQDANSEELVDQRVQAKTDLLLKANAAMDGKADFKGKTIPEIHRMVVAAHLGDEMAKTFDAPQMEGAFRAVTANIKPKTGVDRMTDSLNLLQYGGGSDPNNPKAIKDAAYGKYVQDLSSAWKTPRTSQ